MLEFLTEIFLILSSTESFLIMTVTSEISIKMLDSSTYIIGILTKILEISPENFKTLTKILVFFWFSTEKSLFRHKS